MLSICKSSRFLESHTPRSFDKLRMRANLRMRVNLRMKALGAMLGAVAIATTTIAAPALAQQAAPADPAVVDRYVASLWSKAPDAWKQRNTQDETQKICSTTNNQPSDAQAKAIVARELAAVKLPADGKFMGDWKKGQQVAQRGSGGQFSDQPDTYRGGNCYACHQLSKQEVSYGTLGPSLLEYGKMKDFKDDEIKAAYTKIWNAQAVLACSNMPRFGHTGFLSEEQIKDVVAYLFDKDSPVNK
jgi:L-cysteine S-thiosulfotransferase